MPRTVLFTLGLLATSLAATGQTFTTTDAFGIDVSGPVEMVMAPGQPDRVYIVEQGSTAPGFESRVVTFEPGDSAAEIFLNLGQTTERGGEKGLLGLAFHPDYATNGRAFISYTAPNPLRSVISEVARSGANPLQADLSTETVILEVPQPRDNHNGGQITFGPDGLLYIALGDGGGPGDPDANGQDLTNLFGAILRIDVDTVPDGETYGIPDANPFALTDGPERDEIYAWGFRNPWKFAFDREGGDLWAMDVGEGRWEEISRVEVGKNYGWGNVEGPECFVSGCDLSASEAPVFAYDHGAGGGLSISGGMVYRGSALPELQGQILYADFVNRRVWSLDASGAQPDTTLLLTAPGGSVPTGISAVREGPGGEPYLLAYSTDGPTRILKLEAVPVGRGETPSSATRMERTGPNPFRAETAVRLVSAEGGAARLALVDALGREVAVPFEGTLAPGGAQSVRIDGHSLAPGVYTLRWSIPGVSDVRTMSIVRVR